jgi:hypothetical protein
VRQAGYKAGRMAVLAMALGAVAAHALPPQSPYSGAAVGRPTAENLPGLGAGHGDGDDTPFGTREMQARQLKRLRAEHQKQVVADSARLLQLVTALKAETDKGVTASPGELKDVEEIAKLAKRLSERIKNQ